MRSLIFSTFFSTLLLAACGADRGAAPARLRVLCGGGREGHARGHARRHRPGPRHAAEALRSALADGTYPKTLASDDDSGYGKLSKIGNVDIAIGGFYLAELTTPEATGQHARLKLSCVGSCQTDAPVTPLTEDLRWYTRSAERRSLTLQTYRYATERLQDKAVSAPPSWAVVLDVDETTLNNSAYQKSRQDLGVGFSPASWTAWVAQKAAPAIGGVVEFTKTVHRGRRPRS